MSPDAYDRRGDPNQTMTPNIAMHGIAMPAIAPAAAQAPIQIV